MVAGRLEAAPLDPEAYGLIRGEPSSSAIPPHSLHSAAIRVTTLRPIRAAASLGSRVKVAITRARGNMSRHTRLPGRNPCSVCRRDSRCRRGIPTLHIAAACCGRTATATSRERAGRHRHIRGRKPPGVHKGTPHRPARASVSASPAGSITRTGRANRQISAHGRTAGRSVLLH
jgi:hypothetical protein